MGRHAFLALIVITLLLPRPASSQLQQLRHWSGQNVSPTFEGWEPNPDGTSSLWFGYMNRNDEEQLDIPVGPDNNIQPGSNRIAASRRIS